MNTMKKAPPPQLAKLRHQDACNTVEDQQGSKAAEVYEKILIANLQRAIDFVKFAEAKNAALLALSSAWVVAMINLEFSGRPVPNSWAVSIVLTLLCSLCAALLAMTSFLPKLDLPGLLGGKQTGPHHKNLLFFGDISTLTIKSLEADLHSRYCPKANIPTGEYIHDLVVQIGVNSKIARRKMRFFIFGMWLIVFAALILLVPVILMSYTIARAQLQI